MAIRLTISVRKKGKKWYYRFYVEDASGNLVQKECAGTESKSETEKLLRQAMEDYESMKFIAKADNITLGQLLDTWAEEADTDNGRIKPLSFEQYQKLIAQLGKRSKDAILPEQIAYFTGLRLGEVAGLTWQDINLEEQYLTVRRSVRYTGATHKHEIGSAKRKKLRIVDFGNALADILKKASKQQLKNRMQYGELYHKNFYREVTEKNRVH